MKSFFIIMAFLIPVCAFSKELPVFLKEAFGMVGGAQSLREINLGSLQSDAK